jgi:hypothetical protein
MGDILYAKFLAQAISIALSVFNQILRTVVILIIGRIGYASQTRYLQAVTMVTFLCQFFNTAFVLLLVNADLSE